jgi:hypothetical protein
LRWEGVLTPNPILRVLFSMQKHRVRCLLMGGQACVLYGAAEFSRDTDLAILSSTSNLEVLRTALDDLQASCIAVPPFERRFLEMGLAIHFRCQHPEARDMPIDVMSRMRGVDDFAELWQRRTTLEMPEGAIELMALPDLVKAKKTQRDKDWPMLTRLVEANYFAHRGDPTSAQVEFWLGELRTPSLLVEAAANHSRVAKERVAGRPLLLIALAGDEVELDSALRDEEATEREADRQYWVPLRAELQQLRRERQGPG